MAQQKRPVSSAADWTDRLSSVVASNRYMLETEDGCDVTLIVKGPGDKTETRLEAHRYVLCSRCPEFYRMLWTGRGSSDKKLKITDTQAEIVKILVRFLYCEEVALTADNVFRVLRASRQYNVLPLIELCKQYVCSSLSENNVCDMLSYCCQSNEEELIATCLEYIERHTAEIITSESFYRLPVTVLRQIVSRDVLSVSEIDMFTACVEWAKKQRGLTNPNSPTASSNIDPTTIRQYLAPVIELIRFPTMSPDDFARRVVPLNILTDSEACNVYKYFTCPEKPPKRFVTIKRRTPTGVAGGATSTPLPTNVKNGNVVTSTNGGDPKAAPLYPLSQLYHPTALTPNAPDLPPEYNG